jgi:hypothetical protein
MRFYASTRHHTQFVLFLVPPVISIVLESREISESIRLFNFERSLTPVGCRLIEKRNIRVGQRDDLRPVIFIPKSKS